MSQDKKVKHLIVDTSAFIKNAALQNFGNNVITEESVVDEITNKRQLRRLVVLPYDLKVMQAFPEDIKFVTDFSKKTGDYVSLSATDIKVIALTYRLERENVGTEHLKTVPKMMKTVKDSSQEPLDHPKVLAGFYNPEKDENCTDGKDETEGDEESTEEKTRKLEKLLSDIKKNLEPENCAPENKPEHETTASNIEQDNTEDLAEKFAKLECEPTDLVVDCEGGHDVDDILAPVKTEEQDEEISDEEEDEEEEDDDDGWITPKNIRSVQKEMRNNVTKEKPASVACLTTDFAMQNVLMQIGLNVATMDGKVIKEMRSFIFRCYACFKTTGIMTKVFCPHCGYKTLKKVAVTLNDDGTLKIYINYKKKLSSRGKRFSLPTFKGGKHANNPILREDQPVPQQRLSRLAHKKNDPMNDDYIAGYSPFVTRDVYSRSAVLGIRPGMEMKHWMRRNPNEARRKRK